MSYNVIMPEMGEGVAEGTILNWLVQEGDVIKEHDPVLEVETDKVTVEVTADAPGTILKILVPAGQVVSVGTALALVGEIGESVEAKSPASARQAVAQSTNDAPPLALTRSDRPHIAESQPNGHAAEDVRVSPVVARMVREHDLDVTQIAGTGRDGRITKRDVLAFLEGEQTPQSTPTPSVVERTQSKPPTPAPAVPMPGSAPMVDHEDGEIMPLNGMRRSIAEHMVMSKRTSPHVTTVFEFDFSSVAAHRAEHKAQYARDGVKLTYMPYIAMATVEALKVYPMVNAMWTDEGILLKKDINLGMAVSVPNGLLVPVIRNADSMNLLGLARAINDVAERGRTNKIKPDELRGGTFSITNHGASGSLIGTPIINQPQVGILGVGMIEKRVKVLPGDAIAIRPCAYVSFSFDHRILDDATADAFVMMIKERMENWR